MVNILKRLRHDTAGATAVEYGLIVSLIVIAILGALMGVADTNTRVWDEVETRSVDAMTN
ncbi:Flp family type IVb pilin [Porphyrobacter sp. YT40]|uniref:Flp family type IVb pilin n=1 Tax=Porphyrobacter sp. YT40 TaxID=2547601 RepID=UPI001145045E|nr:Flp family type IVb pilin [Porphyrobacter sp. YT40]QDH35174.1 Flp family type IVb pilin [Porphyrobacter sp. YT40]